MPVLTVSEDYECTLLPTVKLTFRVPRPRLCFHTLSHNLACRTGRRTKHSPRG
jgi:hypothetical protein